MNEALAVMTDEKADALDLPRIANGRPCRAGAAWNASREAQILRFIAGENSIFYGATLLTTPNASVSENADLLEPLGFGEAESFVLDAIGLSSLSAIAPGYRLPQTAYGTNGDLKSG